MKSINLLRVEARERIENTVLKVLMYDFVLKQEKIEGICLDS